jgi:hypothetical protein
MTADPGTSANTRVEAAACGLSRFWTGRPCKYGHHAERFVFNGQCVACKAQSARARIRKKCATRVYRSVQRRSGQVLRGRSSPSQALGCDQTTLQRHISSRFTEGTLSRHRQLSRRIAQGIQSDLRGGNLRSIQADEYK